MVAFVLAGMSVAASGACAETAESRRRAAQATADRYFERIKVGDYEGAYRNTFSSVFRGELSIEDFEIYHRGLERWTGPIGGFHVVAYAPETQNGRIQLTYALEPADPARSASRGGVTHEILQLVEENGEWRISSLDTNRTPASHGVPQTPAGGIGAPAGR